MDRQFGAAIPLFMFLAVAAVAIIVAVVGYQNRKRERLASQAFAASRGWTYTEEVPALCYRWSTSPMANGHSRRATFVLTGQAGGHQFVSFNYQYTTGSGKNRSTSYYNVTALSLPVPMPWLWLTPDSSVSRFFGGQDIEFESAAFNDAWRVQSTVERFAFDVINPRMMMRLLQPDAVGQQIAIEGADLLLVRSGNRNLNEVDFILALLIDIYGHIPRHVWQSLGYDPVVQQ